METKDWIVSSMFVGLFIIAIMSFGIGIGHNYNKTATEMTGDQIDLTRIESSLNDTTAKTSAWKTAFESDSPFLTIGYLAIQSIWSIFTSMLNVILSLIDLYITSVSNILGVPPIVISVFTGAIIITLIVLIFKEVKS